MAKLVKMSLMGIRNFGPVLDIDQSQQITFGPITLLVGQNGCGKTTVLEALKFICTGDMPPGTNSGKGFVHDPKICGKRECIGQIRLQMRNANGDEYIITKSMKVEQKPTTMTFSRLDSSIKIKMVNGNIKEISSRNTDIDRYCAEILNVPQSIFNSVLFCHQEHALWPLDEGKKVKEKFDEIFDSTKYNKCTEMLRKFIKDKTADLKVLKVEVQAFKERSEGVQKEQIKLNDRKDKLSFANEKIEGYHEAMEPIKKQLREILDIEKKIDTLDKEHQALLAKKEAILGEQNIYKNYITSFFEGSDAQLRKAIESFENNRKEEENVIKELEGNRQLIESKQKENSQVMQKHQVKLGHLKRDYEQYEEKKQQRKRLLEESSRIFPLSNPLTSEMLDDVESLVSKLKNLNRQSELDLLELEKSKKQEENTCQLKLDEVRESSATIRQKITAAKKQLNEKISENTKIEKELREMNMSNNKLNTIKKKVEDTKKTLNNLETGLNEKATEDDINKLKYNIEKMEQKLKELEQLDRLLQENQITEEKIENEQQLKMQKKNQFEQIFNKHKSKLKMLLGDNFEAKNLENAVKSILRQNEEIIKRANINIDKAQRKVLSFESMVKHKENEIKSKEEEITLKTKKVNDICKNKNLSQYIQEVQVRKEKLQKKKGQYSSAKIMYEAFIEQFETEHPECPICKTDFVGKKENVKSIVTEIKQKIKNMPQKLAETELGLKRDEKLFTDLQQLVPLNNEIEHISQVLYPQLRESLDITKAELRQAEEELAESRLQISQPEKIVQTCHSLVGDVSLIDQFKRDIRVCEENIARLEAQLKDIECGKSKPEVESEIDNLKSDIKVDRNRIDELKSKLDRHRASCQKVKNNLNSLMQEKLEIEKLLSNKNKLEEKSLELKNDIDSLQVENIDLEEEAKTIQNSLILLEENKKSLSKRNAQIIEEKRKDNLKKHKHLDLIVTINLEIEHFVSRDLSNEIETQIEKIAEYKGKDDSYTSARNKATQEISNLRELIAKQESTLKNLNDNVNYRKKKDEEQEVNIEIKASMAKLGSYSKESILQDKRSLSLQLEKREREAAKLKGQVEELKTAIEELEKELQKPISRDALKNYRDKVYEYHLSELTIKDVQKYVMIFEKSILDFHAERMVQINRRIRSLWRAIYKGNDIDYIEIRTENTTGNSKRRSYDYKVMMVKRDDTHMEMRGRCSAGQRVLACLVIRIALAELFSSNCGILALDEPTTNLDQENIESLSLALAELINSRKDFKNFQLIVITHDQNFIESLRHNLQVSSYYWNISRDNDGFSKISRDI